MEPLHLGDGSPSVPALPPRAAEYQRLDTEDPARAAILKALEGLSTPRLRQVYLRLRFLDDLTPEDVACIAKSYRPRMSDAQIAEIAGVDRRSLYRWPHYMALKSDVLRFERKGFRKYGGGVEGIEDDPA